MWRDECSRDKASFAYETPEDFVKCFWQKKPGVRIAWVIYRVILVLYVSITGLVVVVLRDLEDSPWYKNPIFFYYWVYFLEFTAFALALALTVKRYTDEKKDPEIPPLGTMTWYFKLLWVIYTTAASSAAAITVVFTVFIYSRGSDAFLTYSVITHVCNTVTIGIDFFFAAIPLRLLHIYLPLTFSVIYGLFTIAYQLSGGTGNQGKIPIYNAMDWRDPVTAIKTCSVHLTCVGVAHCAFYLVYVLKYWMKSKCENPEEL